MVVLICFGALVTIVDGLAVLTGVFLEGVLLGGVFLEGVFLEGLVFEIVGLDGLGLTKALEGATREELAFVGVSLDGRGLAVVNLDLGDGFLAAVVGGFFGTDACFGSGFFLRGLVLAVAETEGFFLLGVPIVVCTKLLCRVGLGGVGFGFFWVEPLGA